MAVTCIPELYTTKSDYSYNSLMYIIHNHYIHNRNSYYETHQQKIYKHKKQSPNIKNKVHYHENYKYTMYDIVYYMLNHILK